MSRLDEIRERWAGPVPFDADVADDIAFLLGQVNALTDALREWFAGARPVGWSEVEHVANPRINRSQRDADLAEFVARRVLGEAS